MKNLVLFLLSIIIIGCTSNNNTELRNTNSKLEEINRQLKDTIELLRYPASERIISINSMIKDNNLDEASREIEELEKLFPKSSEISKVSGLRQVILDKYTKIKEEEERIKALGFKVLKEENTIEVGYNKVSIGSFSIAQTFTFDAYDNRYHLYTADRGNKYISARISITSTSKEPLLPSFYAYSISGNKLISGKALSLRHARWEDYATYLGNYNDNSNDFSKTGTIAFKIGVEVSDEATKEPLLILMKKENCMVRNYERFDNPPVSYVRTGCTGTETLTLEEVLEDYVVVKFYNKNKL